jgi:predicted DNA-binding protein with PD1-like motif
MGKTDLNTVEISKGEPTMVVFSDGDSLVDSLIATAKKMQFNNALISGIGSVSNPVLSHCDPATKNQSKTFSGLYKLITLNGNITKNENKDGYKVHVHTTLANDKHEVIAGHLEKATVSTTAEIIITPFNLDQS